MQVNDTFTVEKVVSQELTAKTVGSGTAEVFATPMMAALMENAAMQCIAPSLEEGQMSVGILIQIDHTSATPVGMKVQATAKILEIDRRRVVFEVSASDESGIIGQGRHERMIVDEKKFLDRCYAKKA